MNYLTRSARERKAFSSKFSQISLHRLSKHQKQTMPPQHSHSSVKLPYCVSLLSFTPLSAAWQKIYEHGDTDQRVPSHCTMPNYDHLEDLLQLPTNPHVSPELYSKSGWRRRQAKRKTILDHDPRRNFITPTGRGSCRHVWLIQQ